jgi:hypothetical protein
VPVRADGDGLVDLPVEGLAGTDELVEHLVMAAVIDHPHRDRV